jgi:hypothetical protein
MLLAVAAHASAEPAAAAATGTDTTRLLAQPVLDFGVVRPAVPRADPAVLAPKHPIRKVVDCLGKVEGPIYPANSTAYELTGAVARCGAYQLGRCI